MSINLVAEIAKHFPDLSMENQAFWAIPNPKIELVDDGDGKGAYIKSWNHSEPMPEELKKYCR